MKKKTLSVLLPFIGLAACSHLKMGMFLLHDNLTEKDPLTLERGKVAYLADCAQCHGMNAEGDGPLASGLSATPTNFRAETYKKSPSRIGAHIAYGKRSAMPAFSDKLSEETIWDISNYLHSLQSSPK